MGGKHLTPQQVKKIKILHNKGWSSLKIGRKFGVVHATVLFNLGTLKKKRITLLKGSEWIAPEKPPKEIIKNYEYHLKIKAEREGKPYKKLNLKYAL